MFMFNMLGYKLGDDANENLRLLLESATGSLRTNLHTGAFLDGNVQNLYDSFERYRDKQTKENLQQFNHALIQCETFPIKELPLNELRIECNKLLALGNQNKLSNRNKPT